MSIPILRNYQCEIVSQAIEAIQAGRNILGVLPTGAGKTVCMAEIARQIQPSVICAHRQELTAQISMALARANVFHRLIAVPAVRKFIIERQIQETKRCWIAETADMTLASVDSLLRVSDSYHFRQARLFQIDEGHHVVPENKWARAAALCPNAVIAGWTATPTRTDRRALGRPGGGFFDAIVQGPSPGHLVRVGFLAPLEIYSIPGGIERSELRISESTGDFTRNSLAENPQRRRITGDVVDHYLRIAPGRRGATFTVNVQAAQEQAAAYRQKGVPAAVLSAGSGDRERQTVIDDFLRGDILQIVNVDILGEGYDCPALEVVSSARPTMSVALWFQQIGRVRRPAPGKTAGIVLDHAGNALEHGLPDGIIAWALDAAPRRAEPEPGGTPIRQCEECWRVFESWLRQCPHCGWQPEPAPVRLPEEAEGDLTLYGPELIAELHRRAAVAAAPPRDERPNTPAGAAIWRNINDRAAAQEELRRSLAWWGGVAEQIKGWPRAEAYRRFYARFGICAASAHGLGGPAARQLTQRIWRDFGGPWSTSASGR